MRKVIFLDRDGVINLERGTYTFLPKDFSYTPHFWENCKQLVAWGYDLVVITNQGGIAKGIYGHEEVNVLNEKIRSDAKSHDVDFLAVYYCPHHHEIAKCLCRKPHGLMLEKACAKYHIDPAQSYFIGDSERDLTAAKNANIKGILIEKNTSMSIIFDQIAHG